MASARPPRPSGRAEATPYVWQLLLENPLVRIEHHLRGLRGALEVEFLLALVDEDVLAVGAGGVADFDDGGGAEDGAGLGLGLVISAQLVRAVGGTLRASNQPEGGALFTVELPTAPSQE